MTNKQQCITVFFDGACPQCIRDQRFYQHFAGQGGEQVKWLDITGQDEYLKTLGIVPVKALTELHIQLANGEVLSELDAYIVLMSRVWLLKPLAFFISLPIIRPFIARIYHQRVTKRLKSQGRM
ncbi:thiol-disulfide oxidoreductase [Colwellia sp. MT41]|uniref:thiol-disulfide oxidoreductase DCC family protein n=1 Tax=Colwellia sp. MT41 TaxID=58049 RepID=UPI00071772BC|nr:DUF393 domain-containing protein [Colwellia sp. MT41]ALO34162.1 thiol-disulfide oxidoreductase [Colwellia sp. MT41]